MRAFTQGLSSSLNYPYFQGNSPPGVLTSPGLGSSGEAAQLFPTAARNPNKAIVTIDALSSRILMANEMTCELFGYQRDDLSGMKVQKLFTEPYSGEQRALMEQNISASGETVLISGKVVSMMMTCSRTSRVLNPSGFFGVHDSVFEAAVDIATCMRHP